MCSLTYQFQILKENKDKKDAEFNERFKHSESLLLLHTLVSSCDRFFCPEDLVV